MSVVLRISDSSRTSREVADGPRADIKAQAKQGRWRTRSWTIFPSALLLRCLGDPVSAACRRISGSS
jgi:hypothetical protein